MCPLRRLQLVEVVHPGLAGVAKTTLKDKIQTMYKVRSVAQSRIAERRVAAAAGRSVQVVAGSAEGRVADAADAAGARRRVDLLARAAC